jgi:aminoglycoside phosphotransferase (APT) family kinase protein
MKPPTVAELEAVILKLESITGPRATLLRAWELKGGISAQMTALEVALAGGQMRKFIVRRPGERTLQLNPNAASDEFHILQLVQAAGVKTQTPYLLDSSGEIFPTPFLVIEYIDGEPQYAPADLTCCVTQIAGELAALHTGTSAALDLTFLPDQMQHLGQKLAARPVTLDDSLDEGRIRDALESVWPLPLPDPPVLLHGDFWPGNLLWQEGKLVAVIDWEDAMVGNPLADFATTRLDMLWIFGAEAMHTFTRQYQQMTRFDCGQLPFWDLYAALRPASRISVWAEGWPELGRSDITEATMRAAHRFFVDQALAEISQ